MRNSCWGNGNAAQGIQSEECLKIAHAVEDANYFHSGFIGERPVENQVIGEVVDAPGSEFSEFRV